MAVGLGLFAALGLALVYPYRSLDERIARENLREAAADAASAGASGLAAGVGPPDRGTAGAPGDPLRLTYMQLWLRARPQDELLRLRLARELAGGGDLDGARAELQRLADSPDPELAGRVALLDVEFASRQAFALAPADARRAQLLAELRDHLNGLARQAWPTHIVIELAERAATLGAREAAALWHQQLLDERVPLSAGAWEAAARRMLAQGDGALAARLYLRARSEARGFDERRRLFFAALQTLQAAGLLMEALTIGEAELGDLANDTTTLEFMTRLALAANRPDIAQRFATRLLRLSWWPHLPGALRARLAASLDLWPPARIVAVQASNARQEPPRDARTRADEPLPGEPAPDTVREPHLPFNDRIYQLSYEVYLANGNLKDALAVARSAVRQAPEQLVWRRRLAQVAEWAGQPALALDQWHAIARRTGEAAAWREVARLATGLFDHERLLEVLQRDLRAAAARGKPEFDTLRRIVDLHERLGEPERAIDLLRRQDAGWRGDDRRRLLLLLADLAERTGRDDLLRTTLAGIAREFGADPAAAARLAAAELSRDRAQAAFDALRAAVRAARDDDDTFWQLYAESARLLGRDADAVAAYRRLIATGKAQEPHYAALIAALETTSPAQAADVAEAAFDRFGTVYLALRAMTLRQQAGDARGLRAWLARLRPEQRAALERNAYFLSQRASFRLASHDPRAAAADLRAALRLAPDNVDFRQLLVWALIATRDRAALRDALRESAALARAEPALWAPFGAGWLLLQEPRQALPYLHALISDDLARAGKDGDAAALAADGNPLLWLGYADALEQMGDAARAWQLRRAAWVLLRTPQARAALAETRHAELDARLVALAQLFEPADAARQRLFALLKGAGRPPSAAAREAARGYWIGREHGELTRAWLLQRYASAGATLDAATSAPEHEPPWARLSAALAEHDLDEVDRMLDTVAESLPAADRIEAARRAGRAGEAQTLAFERLAMLPEHDDLHRRLAESALRAPAHATFGASTLRQRPLHETGWTAGALVSMSPHWQLGASLQAHERHSTDAAQLVGVPSSDRVATLALRAELPGNGQWRLQAFARDGLASSAGLSLQAERDVAPRLRVGVRAALADTATDSAYLRVGGQRDTLGLTAYGKLSAREFVAAGIETNRYAALGGGALGRGDIARLEAGHWLRFEYPELVLRASVTDLAYSARGGLDARLSALLPPALLAGATNATFLPRSTTQFGIGASCGDSARGGLARAWRPWCAFTLTSDGREGGNYEWTIGATGSVLGADALELGFARGSARAANASPYTQFVMHYRRLF
jgi:hypothetical protein